ncbi:hypothetical protein V6N13_016765 [Hibiscus sabdariffa]
MRVLLWNVRGLGSSVKRKEIRSLLRQQRAEMVFLLESKMESVGDSMVKSVWWKDSFRYVFSPSVGLAGGILIIWEVSKFSMSEVHDGSCFLYVSGLWLIENWNCGMVATYAPCGAVEQGACWWSLSVLISSCGLLVCCGGDFNSAGLLDLPASGCKYTWHGSESKASRLDRFLVLVLWIEKFMDLVQHNLPRSISNHSSVRLSSGVTNWGPRPFRFLNCWLEKSAHVRLIGAEWSCISEEARSPVSSMDKLRSLKSFLKVWNRVSFGSVDLQIETTKELLNDLDEQGGLCMAPEDLAMTRCQLHGNLWRLLKY